MRVKICGVRTPEDIEIAVKADADAVGLLVGQVHASPDFILPSTAERLARQLPPYITPVIVTHLTEAEAIMEIVVKTGINTIQLHGGSPLKEIKELQKKMPYNSKLLLAIYITGKKIEPSNYEDFYPYINGIVLDNSDKEKTARENTISYDWDSSAEFVENCPLPVILAGGLTPENVSEAINTVKPYGVDANSSLKNIDGEGRSLDKCARFVRNAKDATSFPS